MDKLDDLPLGMSYVPWQKYEDLYTPDQAFERGTLFINLDKPFNRGVEVPNG